MSFFGEINGFLNGFQAGQKIKSNYDDRAYKQARTKLMGAQQSVLEQKIKDLQDPDQRSANLALTRERANYLGAMSTRLRNPGGGRRGATGEVYDDDPNVPSVTDASRPVPEPTPGPQSDLESEYQPEEDTTQFAAEGGKIEDPKELERVTDAARAIGSQNSAIGAIERMHKQRAKGYAEGGMVDEDDDPNDEDDTMPDTASSTQGSTQGYGGFAVEAGRDAVNAALQYGKKYYGLNQPQTATPDPQRGQRIMAYLGGKGAPPPALMQQVYDKIDPKRQMTEGVRNMAAYSALWQFYMKKGQPDKAQKAVLGILQQNRVNAMHYAALSKAALEGGNLDGAAQFAAKAYANVPTGKDVKIEKDQNGQLVYTATDEATGKVIKKGIMSPQELGAQIMGFTPDKFDDTITEMAGKKAPKPARELGPPRGDKPTDVEKRAALVDQAAPDDVTDKSLGNVRSLADGILQSNKLRPDDAVKMARMLTDPSQTFNKTEAKGGAYYKFKGGPKVFLSDDMIERITEMRLEAGPESDVPIGQSRAADDPEGAKPSALSQLGERVSDAVKSGRRIERRDNTQRIAKQSADQFEANERPAAPTRTTAIPADDEE